MTWAWHVQLIRREWEWRREYGYGAETPGKSSHAFNLETFTMSNGIAAQLDPSPAIAAVGHLHQDGTLAVAGYVVGPIGRPQWLLLSSPGL